MSSLHRDPKLRASDADRDHVAEQLREHCATGRVTMEEFGERLERCYVAQTYGDLDRLVEDLPAPNPYGDLPVPASDSPAGPATAATGRAGAWPLSRGGRDRRDEARLHRAWAAWSTTSAACWGLWLLTGIAGAGAAGLWPAWVSVPWGGVLLAQELGARGSGDPQRSALPGRPTRQLPGEPRRPQDRPPTP